MDIKTVPVATLPREVVKPVSHPSPGIAGIAKGSYTEIVGITAPSQAAAGDTVNVDVAVKNTWTSSFYVAVTGRYDGVDIAPSIDYLNIAPGQTLHFYFAFTMPNKAVKVDIWSFYWTGTEWYQDDYGYVNVALAALPKSEFRGFGVAEYNKT